MRFLENTKILISEDTKNDPKLIRFAESFEDIDLTTLKEISLRQETFPVGTHTISLGNIALAKFLIVKPDMDLEINVNGSITPLKLKGEKFSKLWAEVTSLTITVAVEPQEVLVLLAGE